MKGLRYILVQWLLPNLMAFVLHVHGNNMIISWRLIFVHCRLFTRHMFMYMDVDRINSVIIIFYCMKCFPWAWHTISPVTSVEYITVQLVQFSSGPIFYLMKSYSAALTSGTHPPPISITSYPPTTGTLSYMVHPLLIFTVMIRSWRNDLWLLSFNFTDVSTTEWWNTSTCMLTKMSFSTAPAICSHRLDDFTDWTVVYTNLV